jgi:hypothetical protein
VATTNKAALIVKFFNPGHHSSDHYYAALFKKFLSSFMYLPGHKKQALLFLILFCRALTKQLRLSDSKKSSYPLYYQPDT